MEHPPGARRHLVTPCDGHLPTHDDVNVGARCDAMRDRYVADEQFERLVAFAAGHNGPPRGFLAYRRNQLELALALSHVDVRGKRVVEVGGGVSGQSFLLSTLADQVVSTDLLDIESVHGGDFRQAAAIREIAAGRLFFVCGRGEALPLRDDSTDVVFSSFVFEHIDDRQAAAREIRRVLHRDGRAVVLVPNVMDTILRALWFATAHGPRQAVKSALIRTGLARQFGHEFRNPPSLRYGTHGRYPSHRAELAASRIGSWDKLFRQQGFEIERRFSVSYEGYLTFFSPTLTVLLQRHLLGVIRWLGATGPGVWLGVSYGFVARPDGRSRSR